MNPNTPQKCTSCGADIESGALFCEACGAPVSQVKSPAENQTRPPVRVSQPARPPAFRTSPPSPAPRPKSNRWRLLFSLGCSAVSCLLMAASLITLVGSISGFESFTNAIPKSIHIGLNLPRQNTAVSTPVTPESTPQEKTVEPISTVTESALSQETDIMITEYTLPSIVLTSNDSPSGWIIEQSKTSGNTNQEWVKGMDDSESVLKSLEEAGRLTDIIYYYTPPGNLCTTRSGPLQIRLIITLLKTEDGAGKYFAWNSFQGETGLPVGRQSLFSVYQNETNWKKCDSRYTTYSLMFRQKNTVTYLRMDALNGALTDQEGKEILLDYGKLIDNRIKSIRQ